jgi:hypothetical protein
MIVTSAGEFVQRLSQPGFDAAGPACPRQVMLVEPAAFSVSTETAADNVYMDTEAAADPERAIEQSRKLAHLIMRRGIGVVVFPGREETPDDIFPNNVFATAPGRFIIGSMLYPGRRREAERQDIRAWFRSRGYATIDLSGQDCVAELTGTLVIDRVRRIGFCGMTGRVDDAGLRAMHRAFGLNLTFAFDLRQEEYHTNVVMAVLAGRACVMYPGAFADPAVPEALAQAFPQRTLWLDEEEKNAFAGNCIALTERDLFMSRRAADALRPASLRTLESWGFTLHSTELDEIEKAGGSLRCMVAEIF